MAESDSSPLYWSIAELVAGYERGDLSPVEVVREALDRIDAFNPELNAFLARLDDEALEQAAAAERAYRAGEAGVLAGIPISVKDTFPLAGAVTTYGSLVHRNDRSAEDSGVVRRLRAAGAVFTGKTNTAEFGQSATTDNRLGDPCRNPWDLTRTPGGSSGGAVASVAAGLSVAAVGADGGGSIRIPAAFTGLVGIKPGIDRVKDEGGLRAMVDFCCPGPFAWRVADARAVLGVLAEAVYPRRPVPSGLRIGWCARPEGRPVDPELASEVDRAAGTLGTLGHHLEAVELPIEGWQEAFGPLVLADEARERGHLLERSADLLTDYERRTIEAGLALAPGEVAAARRGLAGYRRRVQGFFDAYDLIVTPATAVPAFPLHDRPRVVAGERVDWLWGAVPFAAPFNASGNPAASLPCGFARGLPVGLQIVGKMGDEGLILDVAEGLEEALDLDRDAVRARWRETPAPARMAR